MRPEPLVFVDRGDGPADRVLAMRVEVAAVREATDEVVKAMGRLLPQMSSSARRVDVQALSRMVSWDGITLLAARYDGEIVGMLTLVMFPIPSGLRARIEDVVVDESVRGRGVGGALTLEAVRLARAAGRPDR